MADIHRLAEAQQPAIFKIIYHSSITIDGGSDQITANVKTILDCSRAWNIRRGITGALMLNNNHFSQVLEGPSHAVKEIFGHIMCDRRHRGVELLQSGMFRKRDFANWAMAFVGSPSDADVEMAATRRRDDDMGEGAGSVLALLRWLLLEQSDQPHAGSFVDR